MLSLNQNNSEYAEFLAKEIAQKEEMQAKCNSIYEFRILQGFDQNYMEELKAML